MRKRYNTPHRSRVVKTRMTEEEYAEFAERLSAYNMSQSLTTRRRSLKPSAICITPMMLLSGCSSPL